MNKSEIPNWDAREITPNEEKPLYLTRMLDEVNDAIIATDMAFCITYWNKAAERMFGWTAHQALGQNVNMFLKTEFISLNHSEAVRKLITGTVVEVEAIHTCRDGSRINVISRVSVYTDHNGVQVGTVGVIRDVTERKRVEDLLWKNKERESFVLRLIDTLRPLSDPAEIHGAATSAVMGHFGADRCYYCEINNDDIVIRQDARRGDLPSVKGTYPLSSLPIHKSLADAISYLELPVVKNGMPAGILCIVQNAPRTWTGQEEELAIEISERTWAAVERSKAEKELHESLKREAYLLHLSDKLRPLDDQEALRSTAAKLLMDYLQTAQVIIYDWHEDTHDVSIHTQIETESAPKAKKHQDLSWYPYTASLMLTNKVFSISNTVTSPLLGADERKHYMDQNVGSSIIAPIFSNGKIHSALLAWQTTPREWTSAEENLVKETAERLWESLERARSISALKQAEALLQKNNEALERSIEMKDEFLSLISHEFRTPLTVIISAIQMLKSFSWEELPDKAKGYYNTIRQNSNRQLKLVNNILDITKVNSGSFEVHMTNSDVVQLTKTIIESIEPYADRKKIRVVFSFDPGKIIIGIDEEKYERILLNLLSNAIKYNSKGKTITVRVGKRTDKGKSVVSIQVSDDGIGIPADKQEHIFERFGQIDNILSRQAEGTGIGLHLTRMFVELLGGEIKLYSKLGEGSTFTVLLPAKKIKETHSGKLTKEMTDNRTIQLTEIEFSDIYFNK